MVLNIIPIATSILVLCSVASAKNPSQTVHIKSASNWCMMMPPGFGGDIASNEDKAVAFCTQKDPANPNAKVFPKGFIQSAHFKSGDGYVQVTGTIDRSRYSLDNKDKGGQYDIHAPVGSVCAGYNHYVNLIEPHTNVYCIRCCNDKKNCNTGKSTLGCSAIIAGDYSAGVAALAVPAASPSVSMSYVITATTTATSTSSSPTGSSSSTSSSSTSSSSSSSSSSSTSSSTSTSTSSESTTATTTTATPTQTNNAAAQKFLSGVYGTAIIATIAMFAF
ncbi:hypothetical protein BGZ49_000710 [Haplosporangium sp. Z 27]|nr:hypothetical protein BGZ49_000710 [Haplosporangium sp. Z 27]